jgi:hypothetical protein
MEEVVTTHAQDLDSIIWPLRCCTALTTKRATVYKIANMEGFFLR